MDKKFYIVLGVFVLAIALIIAGFQFFSIKILSPVEAPLVEIPSVDCQENNNIIVCQPKANSEVFLPIKVSGQARVFENAVSFEAKDKETGNIIYSGNGQSNSPDMGIFGPFEKEINYLSSLPASDNIILNVFWASPKDGFPLDVVSLPLKINTQNTSAVKVFFSNNNLDPEISCNKVFPVEKIIVKTEAPARKALELLLQGTDANDFEKGYFSSINPDVKIQSLIIDENGTAKVDFDEQLEFQMGGSCRVSAIRAQIVETLRQFSTVKNVIISINGRTEDILQP